MESVARYLVEISWPNGAVHDVQALANDSRAAATELTRAGTLLRFLRSIYVPEHESCFLLFEAESPAAVEQVAARAGLRAPRVSEALSVAAPCTQAHQVCARADERRQPESGEEQ
jgi:hypothetical protein